MIFILVCSSLTLVLSQTTTIEDVEVETTTLVTTTELATTTENPANFPKSGRLLSFLISLKLIEIAPVEMCRHFC